MPILRRDRPETAISLMLDIAFHAGRAGTVSAADIAERLGLARRGMEPLLQALSRAGLLDSVRGPRGGYRLSRAAREITLAEIVAVAMAGEDEARETAHSPVGALHVAVVETLWQALEERVAKELAGLTLDDLLKRAAKAGLIRPAVAPITFAI